MRSEFANFLEYVKYRLEEWADWVLRGNSYGVGYPHRSLIHRLLTEGHIPRSPLSQPVLVNESAEAIEKLIAEMSQDNRLMADALRCQYLVVGTLRTRSARLAISAPRFKQLVEMGHHWLAGRLRTQQLQLKR